MLVNVSFPSLKGNILCQIGIISYLGNCNGPRYVYFCIYPALDFFLRFLELLFLSFIVFHGKKISNKILFEKLVPILERIKW